jgi:type IV pilus assembly protein PilE
MYRRGFTLVEIVIVIAIMGVLLTLAVAGISNSQTNARDAERKADIDALSANLESFYRTGATGAATAAGRYPSTVIAGNEATLRSILRDVDPKAATAPNATNASTSFIAATNEIQSITGVTPLPTTGQYVYQPLQANGSGWALCTTEAQECRKYNLYYRLEATNTVQMVTSKNQ